MESLASLSPCIQEGKLPILAVPKLGYRATFSQGEFRCGWPLPLSDRVRDGKHRTEMDQDERKRLEKGPQAVAEFALQLA